MLPLQQLFILYFVTLFVSIFANVRYDRLNFEFFDNRSSQFKPNVIKSIEKTGNLFSREDVTNVIGCGK